jgi:hypothetical protein
MAQTTVTNPETGETTEVVHPDEHAPAQTNGAPPEPGPVVLVPDEPEPVRGGGPVSRVESWLVAAFFAIAYGVIGYFMLTDGRIVNFDSLARLNEAYMVWWNDPPKLAAIPLDAAPMGALAYMPFTLIKPIATTLVSIPILSAVSAGILMGVLNSLLRRCEFAPALRYPLLLLFGLNPLLVYYAGNGDVTVAGMMLAGVSVASLIAWRITGETRHLAGAGLAIAVAVMFDFGYALWAVGIALAIVFIGHERKESTERHRSSLLVFMAPVVYALLVWILLNTVLVGSPFGWLSAQTGLFQVNTTGVLQSIAATPLDALGDLAEVVLGIAPLGFATILLLLLAGILSRNALAFGLFLIALLAAAVPFIRVLVADQADLMDLSVGLPLALVALAGAAWVYKAEEGWRVGVVALMVIGLIVALPLGWDAMKDYRYQNQAEAFTRWVEDGGSQEGTSSVGGYTVGIDPEVAMATYINDSLPQNRNSILVDENFSYGPMILSGRPSLFEDRADGGEGTWEATVDNPFGRVAYMLINFSRPGDQLRKKYPEAITGGEAGMTPIFRTDRYVLVEVSGTRPPQEGDPENQNRIVPQSSPRPFTPPQPPRPTEDGVRPPVPGGVSPEPASPSQVAPPAAGAGTGGSGTNGGSTAPRVEGE